MKKTGFTLIELVVAIALAGLLAVVSIPNIGRKLPAYQREQFATHLNSMLQVAWQNAIFTHKNHKIIFNLEKQVISIEVEKEINNKTKFEPLKFNYIKTQYIWPENFIIKNFFISGKDELNKPGIKTTEIWFYISPEGLAEDVIINLIDTKELKQKMLGLVLNPFKAQFKKYDNFQKP